LETRLLILNPDPVFQDAALAIFDIIPSVELRIVRSLSEAICTLMREAFDLFVVEGEAAVAIEQATHARQHFPSLEILCLSASKPGTALTAEADVQNIELMETNVSHWRLQRRLRNVMAEFEVKSGTPVEGIDPCHSLIGNLNQFSAADILQMSCLGQRSGRFTFKSSRGTSEIYMHHGVIRHAVYDSLEGEEAVAEIFRWRQGRFYFEEQIISQIQTVQRPWNQLLIANLQRLDETMETVANFSQR
jgi:hypothetical protein